MRTLPLLVLSSLVLAVGGLAWSQAPEAPAAAPAEPPSAELRILSGTSGISANSWVSSYTSETCDGGKRLANFNLFKRGEKKAKVPPGQRLYLIAAAHIDKPVGGDNIGKSDCRGMASFVPEVGKVYEVTHDLKERKCPVLITEAGAPVKTYQKHKAAGPCKDAE